MARRPTLEGVFEPAFEDVAWCLLRQVQRVGGGAAACVYFRGRSVADVWAGKRDPGGARWEHDTMAMSFSTTKGVTSTALHVLADRGLLDYDDPVAKHWPEFGRNGKEGITIRHVMSHRAGLHSLRCLVDDGQCFLDWDCMTRALENAAPAAEPGAYPAYHGITYGWLAGELIQRVSGRPFSEFVQEEIARPLRLDGLYVGAPPAACARAATLSRPLPFLAHVERFGPPASLIRGVSRLLGVPVDLSFLRDALIPANGAEVMWQPDALCVPIPAANGLFTARSLARLYA
ncbi:MAG: serine hydrolase domain-containing protein, partial [Candidatus Binatia bacterium]